MCAGSRSIPHLDQNSHVVAYLCIFCTFHVDSIKFVQLWRVAGKKTQYNIKLEDEN